MHSSTFPVNLAVAVVLSAITTTTTAQYIDTYDASAPIHWACFNTEFVNYITGHLDLSDTSITKIEDYQYQGCTNIKSVSFPASLNEIGPNAFEGSGLTSLHLWY